MKSIDIEKTYFIWIECNNCLYQDAVLIKSGTLVKEALKTGEIYKTDHGKLFKVEKCHNCEQPLTEKNISHWRNSHLSFPNKK